MENVSQPIKEDTTVGKYRQNEKQKKNRERRSQSKNKEKIAENQRMIRREQQLFDFLAKFNSVMDNMK